MKRTDNTSNTEEMVTISRTEYETLRDEKAELQQMNKWLMEQLRLIRKNQFGSKSDTASDEAAEQMSMLFDEAELTQRLDAAEAEKPVSVAAHTRVKKSGALKDILPDNVPVEVEEHRLSGEELQCEICGSEMVEIGKTVRQTMKFIPAQVVIHEDWYYTYACKACAKETDEAQIRRTPKDVSVLPGSFASPEAVAHIMTQKYVLGVPLYRQEADLHRRGIELTRQTMSNWVIKCADRWLTPVYEALHRKLLQEDVIHADETELQVLHEAGKPPQSRSYMWLYRSGKHAEHPIVLYEYQPNRRQENPARFLDGFTGYLQTDCYSGYNAVQNVIHVGC